MADLSDWYQGWDVDGSLASLEDALGLLPGQYQRASTGEALAVPLPDGGSRAMPVETVFNHLGGMAWRIVTGELAPGQHVLFTRLDDSEATLVLREAYAKRRYQHPELAAIRKRASAALIAAITPIAEAHRHMRDKQQWVRDSAWCSSRVWLQRGRGGFECYLNVEYQPKLIAWEYPANSTRVGAFAPRKYQMGGTDALPYVDLDGPTVLRALMLGILADRVMPYLDRCHNVLGERQRRHKPFGMMPP